MKGAVSLLAMICVVVGEDNDPLVLTPYIEKGRRGVEEALELSKLSTDIKGVESYSGFFTVDKKCGNNLFFWFFPAEHHWEHAPVVMWLSSGAEESAVSGVFEEFGPWELSDGDVKKRKYGGTSKYNLLFLDATVGIGYSYSEQNCYPSSVRAAIKETYSALTQFYKMFHQLEKNKLIITGRYFVSHLAPALAVLIKEKQGQDTHCLKVDMKGVLIVNPRTNFECHDFSNQLFQLGIVDEKDRDKFKGLHSAASTKIKQNRIVEAATIERNMFKRLTDEIKLPSYHNFAADADQKDDFLAFLSKPKIRKILRVENVEFESCSDRLHEALLKDYFSSPRENIEKLLKRQEVYIGFYNSQLDIISSQSATLCFLHSLEWPNSEEFRNLQRYKWYLEGEMLGWYKVSGTLLQVLVRKKGHFLPEDRKEYSLALIRAMVESRTHNLLDTLMPK